MSRVHTMEGKVHYERYLSGTGGQKFTSMPKTS